MALAAEDGAELPPPPEAALRDFLVVPRPTPQGQEGQAAINWSTGVLRVAGRGRPKADAATPGQRKLQARTAARDVALRNLAYALEGAPVTSDATFQEYVRRQGGKVEIHSFVRGARTVGERAFEDDSIELTLEAPLRGNADLSHVLYQQEGKRRHGKPKPSLRPASEPEPEGLTPAGAPGPFTGLVVIATGLDTEPVLIPTLFDDAGKVAYGLGVAEPGAAAQQGIAAYARTLAGVTQVGRTGATPLVVRAAGVNARSKGDLILSKADAERVRRADQEAGFLKRAAVTIVLDPPAGN